MAQNQTIVLEDWRPHKGSLTMATRGETPFQVKSLTNCVDYEIGQFISEDDVKILIARSWVTIKIVKAPM